MQYLANDKKYFFLRYPKKAKAKERALEETQPKREERPSRASSSFFSSSLGGASAPPPAAPAPPPAAGPAAAGAAAATATGAAFKASSICTSLNAATRAFTLTSSGVTPAAWTTFLTLSSVIFCFNLCSSKAAYTYSMEKASSDDHI